MLLNGPMNNYNIQQILNIIKKEIILQTVDLKLFRLKMNLKRK